MNIVWRSEEISACVGGTVEGSVDFINMLGCGRGGETWWGMLWACKPWRKRVIVFAVLARSFRVLYAPNRLLYRLKNGTRNWTSCPKSQGWPRRCRCRETRLNWRKRGDLCTKVLETKKVFCKVLAASGKDEDEVGKTTSPSE